jgi:HlyD family secretion protein
MSPIDITASSAPLETRPGLSMASQRRLGYILSLMVFVYIFVWGGLAQISGAVVAPGRVAVESSVKRIQHKEGGIVYDILVHEGDKVTQGQVLARLDPTLVNANDTVIASQLYQFEARKARLEAERDRRADLQLPADADKSADFMAVIEAERRLMTSRRQMREQKKAQLREQIQQSTQEIGGLEAQVVSQKRQYELIIQELKGIKDLYAKGYAPLSRVSELERESERLKGQQGELESSIARARTQTSAIRLEILQVDSEASSEIMTDLKDTESKLGQLEQQHITSQDAKNRVEVKAPVSGTVQQITIHTRGGVVGPAETMMIVVPEGDQLVVEARIDPRKIDQVEKGGRAHIRFTAFDTRTTPEALGTVDSLSSDVEVDEKAGVSYYRARLSLKTMHLPKDLRDRMVAGMPVEVQIETESHSALSYFFKPLSDQMHRTFKED